MLILTPPSTELIQSTPLVVTVSTPVAHLTPMSELTVVLVTIVANCPPKILEMDPALDYSLVLPTQDLLQMALVELRTC